MLEAALLPPRGKALGRAWGAVHQRLPEVGGLRCWVCVCAAPWELLEVSLLP